MLAQQLVLDHLDDVAGRPALLARLVVDEGVGEGRLGPLRRAQPALLDHGVEDEAGALARVGLLLLAQAGVVQRRAADDGGEEGALGGGELGDVLVEVRLGRRLDAVGAPPVVDRVEVVLEDLVLGLLLVDLDRDEDLAGLARQGAVGGEEVVLDVLLGDRRPALRGLAALDGDPHGPRDAGRRDAVVLVEVLVLRREHRLLHGVGHLAQRHRLAVALGVGEPGHLGLAVGVVDDGGLRRGDLVRLGDVGPRVGDAQADQREHPEDEDGPQAAGEPRRRRRRGFAGGPTPLTGTTGTRVASGRGGGGPGLPGLGPGSGLALTHATSGTWCGERMPCAGVGARDARTDSQYDGLSWRNLNPGVCRPGRKGRSCDVSARYICASVAPTNSPYVRVHRLQTRGGCRGQPSRAAPRVRGPRAAPRGPDARVRPAPPAQHRARSLPRPVVRHALPRAQGTARPRAHRAGVRPGPGPLGSGREWSTS